MKNTFKFLLVILVVGFASKSFAQSATIDAQATILQALSVDAVENLEFGNLAAGDSEEILPNDAGAGLFEVQGQTSAEISATFAFPANLEEDGGPGTIPLTIETSYGINSSTNDASAGSGFDPTTPTTFTLDGTTGLLFLFIGGQIVSDVSDTPGLYTAEITLTVEYVN